MHASPASVLTVIPSFKNTIPSITAVKGPNAQNKATFCEGILLWTTGCNVNPKQVQTTARMIIIRICKLDEGRINFPEPAVIMEHKTPVARIWKNPISKAFPFLESLAVVIIAAV